MTAPTEVPLNCHLMWDLKKGTSKIRIEDVTREVNVRLENKWHILPNYLLLCYLHYDPVNADISKAKEALKGARDENNGKFYNKEACQWIIEANEFCIEFEEAGKGESQRNRLIERQNKFTEVQRATVLALHAFCLVRFGPNGYNEAKGLYSEANRLTKRRNFLFLHLHALLLGKDRRVDEMRSSAKAEEQDLWRVAEMALNREEMSSMEGFEFYGRYAEAALGFNARTAVDAANRFHEMADSYDVLTRNYKVLIKFHKVYRVCARNDELTQEIRDEIAEKKKILVERLLRIESAGIEDSQFYHTLALQLQYEAQHENEPEVQEKKLTKCAELLTRAQKHAAKPGHIFVDLMLIDVRIHLQQVSKKMASEFDGSIQDEYRSLRRKYSAKERRKDLATVIINQGCHLIAIAVKPDIDLGIKTVQEAIEKDAFSPQRLSDSKRTEIKQRLLNSNKIGYLAWFEHLFRRKDDEDDEAMSKTMKIYEDLLTSFCETDSWKPVRTSKGINNPMVKDSEIFTEQQFVTAHLALLYIGQGRSSDAKKLESKLPGADNSRIKLERLLVLKDSELSTGDYFDLISLADQFPERGRNICQKLLTVLKSFDGGTLKPQTREAFELCAKISNAICIHGDDKVKAEIEDGIKGLLEINSIEDEMRRHRLQATRLHLIKQRTSEEETSLRDNLLHTLRTARSSLDKSCKILFPNSSGFPFAFHKKSGTLKDFMLASIQNRKHFGECFIDSVKQKVCTELDHNWDIINPLRQREYDTFVKEGGWLSRWLSIRNDNEHNASSSTNSGQRVSLIAKLDKDLQHDHDSFNKPRGLIGPQSAYELAHRAAEFAEETANCFNQVKQARDTSRTGT